MDVNLVDEAQELVDRLADRLRQSVAVDDLHGNLIVVSRHFGDADPYRVRLMLDRRIPREYRDYFTSYTRDASTSPVRVPARPDLSLTARIGFPIRGEAGNVAFLWLVDLDKPVPQDLIERYCSRLAHVLSARRRDDVSLPNAVALERHIRALLAGERPFDLPPETGAAARSSRYVAVAHYAETATASERPVMSAFRDVARSTADLGVSLVCTAELDGCSVAVYRADEPGAAGSDAREWLLDECRRSLGGAPGRFGCGISRFGELDSVRELFARAAQAAFICLHLYHKEDVVAWDQVAPLASLTTHDPSSLDGRTESLDSLLRDPESFAFVTVGALLRSGRSRSPAEILHVHRTTLHYRLQQITELTGLDMAVPADRFLGFAVWLRVAMHASPLEELVKTPVSGKQV
ncbi:helix-turn-helix domain-containing protein [Mycolicibacterium baixiangningiae]|uniref:helix-turn-helix domain-containing protein n=1 Tax=Mycolicibacterium baixiangningiae TaxID=2761578 RepID=UPI0018681703|nr:PucR family transcriptional regulator [Mycolicibacterium baixiangningiae]